MSIGDDDNPPVKKRSFWTKLIMFKNDNSTWVVPCLEKYFAETWFAGLFDVVYKLILMLLGLFLMLKIFENPDPGFGVTAISIGTNFVLSNMLLYGLTGRARLSYLISMATIPFSVFFCLRDSQRDFDKWKELRALRLKGVPERFMPYKCKYDWTDYEKVLNEKARR